VNKTDGFFYVYDLKRFNFQSNRPTQPAPAPVVVRCECGGEKAECGTHSDWCPKYAPTRTP